MQLVTIDCLEKNTAVSKRNMQKHFAPQQSTPQIRRALLNQTPQSIHTLNFAYEDDIKIYFATT
jgi:hypothetical protein